MKKLEKLHPAGDFIYIMKVSAGAMGKGPRGRIKEVSKRPETKEQICALTVRSVN